MIPNAFSTSKGYIDLELRRIRLRLKAYAQYRDSPEHFETYRRTAVDLLQSRSELITTREAFVAAGGTVPFHILARDYALEPLEEELLWLCMVPQLSDGLHRLLLQLSGHPPGLRAGFIGELLEPNASMATPTAWCAPESKLIRAGLLEIEHPNVRVPGYVVRALRGEPGLDPRLTDCCAFKESVRELYSLVLPTRCRNALSAFLACFAKRGTRFEWRASVGGVVDGHERSWVLLITGPQGTGKTSLAEAISAAFARPLVSTSIAHLSDRPGSASALRLSATNAGFLNAVWHVHGLEHAQPPVQRALAQEIERLSGRLVILEIEDRAGLSEELRVLIEVPLELERPDFEARVQLWESLLPMEPPLAENCLSALASSYQLSGGQIERALRWAVQRARARSGDSESTLQRADLEAGAERQLRAAVSSYTQVRRVELTLQDLVLPDSSRALVMELLDACRVRMQVMNDWGLGRRLVTGKGLVSLFLGEPGTGKTLCAEILANELELELHMVSIPDIVSKWVGETEKNLRELFMQARAQKSMLLFDEADALFAKRVKVERASDHFQNMEVNMLLQEIERFDGVVILTTNLEANMDPAFGRRILFKIEFPTPDAIHREQIWRTLVPAQTPRDEPLDFRSLGQDFALTGGQIKNAIVRASFRCCASGHGLTQQELARAARQQATDAGHLSRSPR